MQVVDHEPSNSRCICALARRRRNQQTPVFVIHRETGHRHRINTPDGTFHPERLKKALELVESGDDPQAVFKLVDPYRLDGPNPRPDVLSCIFSAMSAVAGWSRTSVRVEQGNGL